MPNLNGTGPNGEGKLTGRGLGKCANIDSDKDFENFRGLGRGRGRCNRYSRRNRYINDSALSKEVQALKDKISDLEDQLNEKS